MKITNWRGEEIKVGQTVTYPVRRSSSMWLVEGVVRELHPGTPDAIRYWDRTPHAVTVERTYDSSEAYGSNATGKVKPKQVRVGVEHLAIVQPREGP